MYVNSNDFFFQLLEMFDQYVTTKVNAFSPPMRQTARLLLTNQQGGLLAQMRITPERSALYKSLGAIVMHTTAVLFSCSRQPILLPFVNMLSNPSALAVRTVHLRMLET